MTPLLSMCRRVRGLLPVALLLTGCHSTAPVAPFTATGYIADGGIVRLWRLEGAGHQPQAMMRVFTPLDGTETQIDRYTYRDGHLYQIRQQTGQGNDDVLQLRFDMQGSLSYMQRLRNGSKEMPGSDEVAKAQYQARHAQEMATTLAAGGINLIQGRWQGGIFTRCDGQVAPLPLSGWQAAQLARREANSRGPLWVAWLSAPEGAQLLQVANHNICAWAPTEKTV